MREYRIPLIWQEYGHIWVMAGSEAKAKEIALGPGCPLPEGTYVDDSVMVDEDAGIETR